MNALASLWRGEREKRKMRFLSYSEKGDFFSFLVVYSVFERIVENF